MASWSGRDHPPPRLESRSARGRTPRAGEARSDGEQQDGCPRAGPGARKCRARSTAISRSTILSRSAFPRRGSWIASRSGGWGSRGGSGGARASHASQRRQRCHRTPPSARITGPSSGRGVCRVAPHQDVTAQAADDQLPVELAPAPGVLGSGGMDVAHRRHGDTRIPGTVPTIGHTVGMRRLTIDAPSSAPSRRSLPRCCSPPAGPGWRHGTQNVGTQAAARTHSVTTATVTSTAPTAAPPARRARRAGHRRAGPRGSHCASWASRGPPATASWASRSATPARPRAAPSDTPACSSSMPPAPACRPARSASPMTSSARSRHRDRARPRRVGLVSPRRDPRQRLTGGLYDRPRPAGLSAR